MDSSHLVFGCTSLSQFSGAWRVARRGAVPGASGPAVPLGEFRFAAPAGLLDARR